jgi:hypothetical protein
MASIRDGAVRGIGKSRVNRTGRFDVGKRHTHDYVSAIVNIVFREVEIVVAEAGIRIVEPGAVLGADECGRCEIEVRPRGAFRTDDIGGTGEGNAVRLSYPLESEDSQMGSSQIYGPRIIISSGLTA